MSFALRLAALGLLLFGFVRPEWVEIPQFSDQHKVYRPALNLNNQQQQQHNSDRRLFHADGPPDRFSQKVSYLHQEIGLRNVSEFSGGNRRHPASFNEPSFVGTIATYTTERVIGSIVGEETHLPETDEAVQVETFEEEDSVTQFDQPPIELDDADDRTTTTDPLGTSTDSSKASQTTTSQRPEDDKGFLEYLPIDLLKRVHKTLQSQPATIKGKIRFLKLFERTLVTEIESRLSAALSPARSPRGARDHHDEHDDGIGFPSLEGTLMAISFLTFAVYLVRLVMMLFRNANNGNAPPIFIGRKRRSVDDSADETARILSYLDSTILPSRY